MVGYPVILSALVRIKRHPHRGWILLFRESTSARQAGGTALRRKAGL